MADAINPQVVVTVDDLRKLWAEKSQPKAVLTVEDLMERWGVGRDVVLQHAENDEHRLPCWSMHGPKRGTGKKRVLRFRLADVEAWEAEQVRRAEWRAAEPAPEAKANRRPAGYTGKVYHSPTGKAIKRDPR